MAQMIVVLARCSAVSTAGARLYVAVGAARPPLRLRLQAAAQQQQLVLQLRQATAQQLLLLQQAQARAPASVQQLQVLQATVPV